MTCPGALSTPKEPDSAHSETCVNGWSSIGDPRKAWTTVCVPHLTLPQGLCGLRGEMHVAPKMLFSCFCF